MSRIDFFFLSFDSLQTSTTATLTPGKKTYVALQLFPLLFTQCCLGPPLFVPTLPFPVQHRRLGITLLTWLSARFHHVIPALITPIL